MSGPFFFRIMSPHSLFRQFNARITTHIFGKIYRSGLDFLPIQYHII